MAPRTSTKTAKTENQEGTQAAAVVTLGDTVTVTDLADSDQVHTHADSATGADAATNAPPPANAEASVTIDQPGAPVALDSVTPGSLGDALGADEDGPEPWPGLVRAASDVIGERVRQVEGEGFGVERDDEYTNGQLARAAVCYVIPSAGMPSRLQTLHWPFSPAQLKPGAVRADLVKAGALIIAEIERLDRAESANA